MSAEHEIIREAFAKCDKSSNAPEARSLNIGVGGFCTPPRSPEWEKRWGPSGR